MQRCAHISDCSIDKLHLVNDCGKLYCLKENYHTPGVAFSPLSCSRGIKKISGKAGTFILTICYVVVFIALVSISALSCPTLILIMNMELPQLTTKIHFKTCFFLFFLSYRFAYNMLVNVCDKTDHLCETMQIIALKNQFQL